ncbi:crossover junction endonuclease MUS81 [Battus philenor]|uniref:crossover junction endonuclease MUS81 n=1 Tax=Battus philenor TaxID=42288 RepID=UPI0035CEB693
MESLELGKRITLKRKHPNPLFQSWLEDLHNEAKEKKSKLENILNEALTSLSKYPLPLHTGAECAILKGFNKRLCAFLDKKLEIYNSSNKSSPTSPTSENIHTKENRSNFPAPSKYVTNSPTKVINLIENELITSPTKLTTGIEEYDNPHIHISPVKSTSPVKTQGKSKIAYKPAYQSGGYAILIALFEQSNERELRALDKETLIERAQKHCDTSFTVKKPESFYTAWSNMQRLISKGLVQKSRSKKVEYSLTDEGYLLAKELFKSSQNIPSTDDLIFNHYPTSQSCLSDKELNKSIENNNPPESTNIDNSHKEYIDFTANSFDIILLIDKNETSGVSKKDDPTVVQFKKYPHICHEYRSLKVGDYAWVARNRDSNEELVLPCIVERKRIDDLAASIKDGRFHEQKFRLRRCGIDNVIYLVEYYGSNKNVGLPVQSLMQALANTRVIDDFKVHITKSLSHSARFLAILTKRLAVRYKDKNLRGWDASPKDNVLMTFNYFNKTTVKSKPLSVNEMFIKILLQLKGVSVEKAVAITNQYKTPHSLIKTYKHCNEREGEMLLANLKYGDLGRNVGPTVSKTIYRLFI